MADDEDNVVDVDESDTLDVASVGGDTNDDNGKWADGIIDDWM